MLSKIEKIQSLLNRIMPCCHRYKAVHVFHYFDWSFDQKAPSTCVTLQCIYCGRIIQKTLYGAGFVTLEELNESL